MQKMNIVDASSHLGVSKEAIHNRVRRGTLESVMEDGVKYVFIDKSLSTTPRKVQTPKATQQNDKYYTLLETQNKQLQDRVTILESETRTLRDQKELMLISEKEKIEQIYRDKDEQLKNILSSFSTQFMLDAPVEKEEHLEAEIEEISEQKLKKKSKVKYISLKKLLKTYSKSKRKKVKKKVLNRHKKDSRIIKKDSKIYVERGFSLDML